ncbi:MAG: DUF2796 domain-containing protein, partial [Betaproteobacteria bacterium]|nr:DUF2796 domain-containing protein [Betaproteobacteria bacterium]
GFYLIPALFHGYGGELIEMTEVKCASRLPGFQRWAMLAATIATGVITELTLPVWAHGSGPHVHGQAILEIAIDEAMVQVNLNSPLDNLLGFEHAPRNERERKIARTMATKLHQADNLFIFTPAARCRLESARLESPMLSPDLLMPVSGNSVGKSGGGTSGISKAPSPAPSAPVAASDDHAELDATWNFRCVQPQALQGLDVRLFQAFPGLRRIDAAIAGPKGQSSARLSPTSTRLKWD